MYFIKKRLLGSTPRQTFDITYKMPSVDFGTLLPRLSLIATIGFAYSILSPLINAVAFVSFTLFFIAYKFLFMQVYDQPEEAESGGMYFPMAISNLCMCFFLVSARGRLLMTSRSRWSLHRAACSGDLVLPQGQDVEGLVDHRGCSDDHPVALHHWHALHDSVGV